MLGHGTSFGTHSSCDNKVKFKVSHILLLKPYASLPEVEIVYSGHTQDYSLEYRKEIFELLFMGRF